MNGKNKHEGMIRGFYHYNEAWYKLPNGLGDDVADEVTFGFFESPQGGTTGEIHVSWIRLSNDLAPKLEAFDDSWDALSTFGDVIHAMGQYDDQNITPEAFCALLVSCGFHDMTQRKGPYEAPTFPKPGDKALWGGMNATVGESTSAFARKPGHYITLDSGKLLAVLDSDLVEPLNFNPAP